MVFFKRPLTEAEQAQRRARKELERLAKTQRKFEAMEEKAQKAQRKQQQKSIARSEKEAQRQAKQEQQAAYKAMKEAKKAAKQRGRLARHAAKLRGHRRDISDRPVSCSATASASDVAGTEIWPGAAPSTSPLSPVSRKLLFAVHESDETRDPADGPHDPAESLCRV
uniref:Uncharacterized protein n=1 Tax=Hyaloperonospora arabidopsidis (strain Emoy2) TaxID=559515 RepID=M4B9E6_HYAAE